MKLFIAVPVENENDYEYLSECSDKLKRNSSAGSFVRFANFHVTLIYIGETDRMRAIEEIMDGVLSGHEPFELVIDRTGTFSQGKSTTVWVGGNSERLIEMHDALWSALTESGFEIEKRKYKPHITIARKVVFTSKCNSGRSGERDRKSYAGARARALDNPPHILPIKRIVLYSSEVIDSKRVYRELYSTELRI